MTLVLKHFVEHNQYKRLEALMKAALVQYRMRGEWFAISEPVLKDYLSRAMEYIDRRQRAVQSRV